MPKTDFLAKEAYKAVLKQIQEKDAHDLCRQINDKKTDDRFVWITKVKIYYDIKYPFQSRDFVRLQNVIENLHKFKPADPWKVTTDTKSNVVFHFTTDEDAMLFKLTFS